MHTPSLTTLIPTLLTLPLLTTAHFILTYPPSRNGANDDVEQTSPCSGLPVSSNRTSIPLSSFPIALEMGHTESVIQILLSLSEDPKSEADFNITLERTFAETGLGAFCLPGVKVPEGVEVGDGMRGTVQVVTDGEGGGGLYACADVIFTKSAPTALPSSCQNNTGVTASALPAGDNINANQSDAEGQPQSGGGGASSSASGSATAASGSASSSSSAGGAAVAMATGLGGLMGWGVVGGLVVGGMAAL